MCTRIQILCYCFSVRQHLAGTAEIVGSKQTRMQLVQTQSWRGNSSPTDWWNNLGIKVLHLIERSLNVVTQSVSAPTFQFVRSRQCEWSKSLFLKNQQPVSPPVACTSVEVWQLSYWRIFFLMYWQRQNGAALQWFLRERRRWCDGPDSLWDTSSFT